MEGTTQSLKAALLSLMRTKDFKDVTVSELCKKADVSRMAFYRHYSVVNDIFRELAIELNQQIIDEIGSPFRKEVTAAWYERAFQMIAEKKDDMSIMYQENFQFEWMQVVNSMAVHSKDFKAEKTYQRLMWIGGFENVVAHWLKGGMKETPKEMAAYCIQYLPHMLQEGTFS